MLEVEDIHAKVDEKKILTGVSFTLEKGKVYVLMGPNGSGKSTLANILMGNPKFTVTKGSLTFNGTNLNDLAADERAKLGLFLSFQYPYEIAGVTLSNFLRTAYNNLKEKLSVLEFKRMLNEKMKLLGIKEDFATRYLNQGFSGGEKKKGEILQLLVLDPKLAILDETDSGLDIDALKAVSQGVNTFMNKEKITLIITHYKRILEFIKPDEVLIMMNGKIVQKGDVALVDKLEEQGYDWINNKD